MVMYSCGIGNRIVEQAYDLQPGRIGQGIAQDCHAQLAHHPLRGEVVVFGASEDAVEVQLDEGIIDHASASFAGIALFLVGGRDHPEQTELGRITSAGRVSITQFGDL